MDINEIKAEKSKRYDDLIKETSIFFAFNNEQFHKNKTPLQEGEKYVSIGAGGYMPKGKVNQYLEGVKLIEKWYKTAIKESKLRKQNIAYELNNHEAFYTNDITDTLESLGSDYTKEEVLEVFRSEQKKYAEVL